MERERRFLRRNRGDGDMEIDGLIIDNHDSDGRQTRFLDSGVVFQCCVAFYERPDETWNSTHHQVVRSLLGYETGWR